MVAITALRDGDRPRWAALWRDYLAFYETSLPAAQYDHTWARLRDGRMHALVARDAESQAIGLTHFLFHEHGWTSGPACYLQDLFVAPDHRATGAGRALIEAVAEAAGQAGASRLYWLTHETNATARRLYDRVAKYSGFVVYQFSLA